MNVMTKIVLHIAALVDVPSMGYSVYSSPLPVTKPAHIRKQVVLRRLVTSWL